ncbi:enoyl-CoA hydratase/isomerase family protein [Sphingomonas sp. ID0503]|uniref:enoyl-CoA hydratase/isomerase family protein n=1 Tax=Sphingomonas sp. ID0503 TaxID=3399691 RepID=UPI003AFAEB03
MSALSSNAAGLDARIEDGLLILTLDRPEVLNALTREMIDELRRLTDAAENDPEVFAIAITGAGRAFCSGLDISLLAAAAESGGSSARQFPEGEIPGLFVHLLACSKPVVCALNGVAAVGGFVLAMMCDLRFASENASLTAGFSNRGLPAEHGTSWLLPRRIGTARALDFMWTSAKISATEAQEIGLVEHVVPAGTELNAVKAYVADLKARVSPRALAMIKQQVYGHLDLGFRAAVEDSFARALAGLKHPDIGEGARAFMEKRPPRFLPWTGE